MELTRMIRVALASRKLFRNWLWAGIKHMLYRLGLLHIGKVAVHCRDGLKNTLPADLYGTIVNAYYDGLVSDYSCKDGIIKFVYGPDISINDYNAVGLVIGALRGGWRFESQKGYWFRDNIKLKHSILNLYAIGFLNSDEYAEVDAMDKVVVDVGAFVGESAIYFILRGAKRVIAIEPHPEAYHQMLENIKLNGLGGKVITINAGLASKHGKICLKDVDAVNTQSTYHEPGNCEHGVDAITLSDILNKYVNVVDEKTILKLDCEGCEFDVILNDYESVRRFDEVVFEFHGGSIAELLNALSRDFQCQLTKKHSEHLGVVLCKKAGV